MITLSVLISSIPEHSKMLDTLMLELSNQIDSVNDIHPVLGDVEILFDNSIRFLDGGLSIGKKREGLYQRAKGLYSACVDCDDWIAPNYIESILRLCYQGKDICTFRNFTKTDFYWTIVDMSLKNLHNEEATPEKIVKRLPWHICPVKSEYAKLYEFEDSNYGEDFSWMEKVLTHCKSEAHTDQVLHCYQHSSKTSESDRITNYQQNGTATGN